MLGSEENKKRLIQRILVCIFPAVLTYIAFNGILENDFILYDDQGYVTENEHVLSGLNRDSISWAFHSTLTGNWIPVTWLSHMLDTELYGADPKGHHFHALILHICNVLLVFLLVSKMTRQIWTAAIIAVLFGIHPLRAESVAWASERKDLLSALFGLLALITYIQYTATQQHFKKIFFYTATFILLILGLMSKAMLVTWPFVFLLMDFWPLKRFQQFPLLTINPPVKTQNDSDPRPDILLVLEKIPFLLLTALFSVIAFIVQQKAGAVMSTEQISTLPRMSNAVISYIRYLEKIFWPENLALLYPLNPGSITGGKVALSILILGGISAAAVILRTRKPWFLFGWLWFLGILVPVIGLVQIGNQAMADRYTYLPSIGITLLFGMTASEIAYNHKIWRITAAAAVTVIIPILLVLTWVQTAYWKNSLTIFSRTLSVTENNYVMQSNYGYALFRLGRLEESYVEYTRAAEIRPDAAEPLLKQGIIRLRQKQYPQAIDLFEKALTRTHEVNYTDLYNNLGITHVRMKEYEKAIDCFHKAIAEDPDNTDTLSNIASACIDNGQYQQAAAYMDKALSIKPDSPAILNKYAGFLLDNPDGQLYHPEKAVIYATKACELTNYTEPAFMETLAQALRLNDKPQEALNIAKKAYDLAKAIQNEALAQRLSGQIQTIENILLKNTEENDSISK